LACDGTSPRCRDILSSRKLSRYRMSVGIFTLVVQIFDVIRDISRYGARPIQGRRAFLLTARRYNFVSVTRRQHRNKSVPIGQKAVTVRGEYGAVFAVQVQVLWPIRVSRYKVDREQITSQGIQSFKAGTGAVAV